MYLVTECLNKETIGILRLKNNSLLLFSSESKGVCELVTFCSFVTSSLKTCATVTFFLPHRLSFDILEPKHTI